MRAAIAAILGLALWLSAAVLAPVTINSSSAWLAALPSWPGLGAALLAAGLLVAWRPPSHGLALLPLVAVLLPWTPGIDAGLLYAGPLLILVWAAVLALGWGTAIGARIRTCGCATDPSRAMLAAFLIVLTWTSVLAWRVAPMVPSGDEPHYLIITQSLIKDGDLRVENNHRQRDFAEYAEGELPPQYLARGRNGAIYPVHAPGLSALVVPAFAAAGYTGVVVFLIVVMALAAALLWRIAWMATGDMAAAWFGWAIVVSSCTWAFQSFLVFPDAMGAAAVACGLWLILRLDARAQTAPRSVAVASVGIALALLPWLHTRFSVLAAGLGLMILARLYSSGTRMISIFLAGPILSAAAWFGFFQVIYGTPNPLKPWGGAGSSQLAWIPGGFAGMLFDQQFGLLPYAPALAAGFAGLLVGTAARWRRSTRIQIACVMAVYVAASASYVMWWGGLSVPARLLTVLLPFLAPAGAVLWQRAHNPVLRAALSAALGWTIFATASLALVERGLFAWNVRQQKAGLWFDWVAPLLQWNAALPAFFRADDTLGRESLPLPAFYAVTLTWLLSIAAAIALAAIVARSRRAGTASGTVSPALAITALVLALPAATVIALRLQGANGSSPARAQMALLSRVADGHGVIVDLGGRRLLAPSGALMSIQAALPSGDSATVRSFGPVPAGRYRLAADPGGEEGQVLIGRGESVATLGDAPITIALPVDIDALRVRGARGRGVTLEADAMLPRRWRHRALRAMRYGSVTVFFVDDGAYAEPAAFWVGGSGFANVVLQADAGVRDAQLELANAPVPNHVSVIGAAQPFARDLTPGESVLMPVVFDANGAARLQIESRSGFVPAHVEPTNRDQRFLGVYVKIRP